MNESTVRVILRVKLFGNLLPVHGDNSSFEDGFNINFGSSFVPDDIVGGFWNGVDSCWRLVDLTEGTPKVKRFIPGM